jgi:hypothetical protein
MSSWSIQCLKTPVLFTPIDSREDSGPTPVPPGFRRLAGYRARAALVAALRAHDAQLDCSKGKLDTAQDAAQLTVLLYLIPAANRTLPASTPRTRD